MTSTRACRWQREFLTPHTTTQHVANKLQAIKLAHIINVHHRTRCKTHHRARPRTSQQPRQLTTGNLAQLHRRQVTITHQHRVNRVARLLTQPGRTSAEKLRPHHRHITLRPHQPRYHRARRPRLNLRRKQPPTTKHHMPSLAIKQQHVQPRNSHPATAALRNQRRNILNPLHIKHVPSKLDTHLKQHQQSNTTASCLCSKA